MPGWLRWKSRRKEKDDLLEALVTVIRDGYRKDGQEIPPVFRREGEPDGATVHYLRQDGRPAGAHARGRRPRLQPSG